MPYNPSETFHPEILAQGMQNAGNSLAAGITEMQKNRKQHENLDASVEMFTQLHPEIIQQVDPKILEKYSKGGIGAKQAILGQLTAATAEKFRNRAMAVDEGSLGIRQQQVDLGKAELEDRAYARVPQVIEANDGQKYQYTPGAMQGLRPMPGQGAAIPPPNGQNEMEVMGNDGKPAYKAIWNPAKGAYEKFDLRAKVDPFASLFGAPTVQTNGQPVTPANGSAVAVPPSAGSAAQPTSGKFVAGKIYRDGKGQRAQYNPDGSWTPVK